MAILTARCACDKKRCFQHFESLGDPTSFAVKMGNIADILQARGELDEALKMRREEVLPVMERLGDVRSRAVTMGKIADILQTRGQLDEALKIRTDEELPVYERLGDVRSRAVTMGKIADILQARGQLDEALRYRMDEAPVYERLGAARDLLIARTEQAITRLLRDQDGDRGEAFRLLALARDEAVRLQLPEAPQIEQFIEQIDFEHRRARSDERPAATDRARGARGVAATWNCARATATLAVPEPEPLTRGLSGTPTTAPRRAPETEDADYVVWYGTNRRPLEPRDSGKGYSAARDDFVHYGSCRVFIPKSHKIGSIGSPWWKRLLTMTDDRLGLLSVDEVERSAYWSGIAAQLAGIDADERSALIFLITHYPQPSGHGTKQEHTAVSAGLNDGAQQGAISKGAQRGPVCCSLRNRRSVPGGGDALALAIRLCLPGLRRAASQLRQDPGALPVYRLSAADIGDRRNDFRSNQGAAVHLVSHHVPPHSEQGRHLQH